MVKIAHMADAHLDSPQTGLSSLKKTLIRREEAFLTFERAVALAAAEGVEIFLIAGDLFDSPKISRKSYDRFLSALRAAPEIRFFLSPGNHDYLAQDSLYRLNHGLKNLHIFGRQSIERVDLEDIPVSVYGAGFEAERVGESLLPAFHVEEESRVNLMVLHGDLDGGADYHPISAREIAASGLDYMALGHIHKRTKVLKEGGTSYAYPGCLEPRGFDEQAEKGLYIGTVGKGAAKLTFHPIQRRMYRELTLKTDELSSSAEIFKAIADRVEESDDLYRIRLRGEKMEALLDIRALSESVGKLCFHAEVLDETKPAKSLPSLLEEQTLPGAFVRAMERKLKGAEPGERETVQRAIEIGLSCLFGQEVSLYD